MFPEHSLFQALTEGATCLTVNKRLARDLAHRYEHWQLAQGAEAWETPEILPLIAWLSRAYDHQLVLGTESFVPMTRLSDAAEHLLWERIIEQAEVRNALLHVPQAAATAQEAYALVHAWQLPDSDLHKVVTAETRAFLRWRRQFDDRCARHHWLPVVRLPDQLDAAMLAEFSPKLWLAGFDEQIPQLQALLERLRGAGANVHMWTDASAPATQAARLALPDIDQELLAAARWARQRAEASPQASIAIVVPDLAQIRPRLLRVFDEVLDESSLAEGEPAAGRLYNLSLGLPLTDYPLVDAALRVLECKSAPVVMQNFSALLRSPFLVGAMDEAAIRARLDAELRREGRWQIDLAQLGGKPAAICPVLAEALGRLHALVFPERATPAVWRQVYTDALSAVGWPGERVPDSAEYQTLEAWRDALARFSQLGVASIDLDRTQALRELRRLLSDTLFQPESAPAAIQVLGLLEASSGRFDHLWLLGLHDGIWPADARPNPLLPLGLQRRLGLPHSSPAHELDYAQRLTSRLLSRAGEVIVSYPKQEKDSELRPSPLIVHLPETSGTALGLATSISYAQRVYEATDRREKFTDTRGLDLSGGTALRGGERLFADEAACPFRAYAMHRLLAKPLDDPEAGLTGSLRGSLMHRALALLWRELKTQARLIAEDEHALKKRIRSVALRAMQALESAVPSFGKRVLALEQERLENLLLQWMQQEKQRTPFEVQGCEETLETEINGLKITLRADRIDRLQDGRLVLIDYKTGSTKPRLADWDYERLQSPQLPLYGLALTPAALVYAWLRPGESRHFGDGELNGEIPGVPPARKRTTEPPDADWSARLARWRSSIEILAQEIRAGEARVDPFAANTCNYCPLPGLCRVESQNGNAEENGDDESE